jgi:hypothetical protein
VPRVRAQVAALVQTEPQAGRRAPGRRQTPTDQVPLGAAEFAENPRAYGTGDTGLPLASGAAASRPMWAPAAKCRPALMADLRQRA